MFPFNGSFIEDENRRLSEEGKDKRMPAQVPLYAPPPEPPRPLPRKEEDEDPDKDRGVIIIDPDGTEEKL